MVVADGAPPGWSPAGASAGATERLPGSRPACRPHGNLSSWRRVISRGCGSSIRIDSTILDSFITEGDSYRAIARIVGLLKAEGPLSADVNGTSPRFWARNLRPHVHDAWR